MLDRLKQAAAEGLVLGVKWGIALLVVGFLVLWAANDYSVVRARAEHGQAAFEYIQKATQQQAAPKP